MVLESKYYEEAQRFRVLLSEGITDKAYEIFIQTPDLVKALTLGEVKNLYSNLLLGVNLGEVNIFYEKVLETVLPIGSRRKVNGILNDLFTMKLFEHAGKLEELIRITNEEEEK